MRTHLPILLLITLVTLAWIPLFLSLSKSTFLVLPPWPTGTWLLAQLALWLPLGAVWLGVVWAWHTPLLRVHLLCLISLMGFSTLRLLSDTLTMHLLNLALYGSALTLLAGNYQGSRNLAAVRTVFFILLLTWVHVWVLQPRLGGFMTGAWYRWQAGLDIPLPWISFPRYLQGMAEQLVPLFPLALVLLFDLGRNAFSPRGPGAADPLVAGAR